MPQRRPSNANSSNTKPKKKKGHSPAHQNTFAYRHNPKSKLTAKILASPNEGLCRRCHDKIEWRKQYRKYKPLTQPATCNICKRRNIAAAYHTICNSCAKGDVAWEKMVKFINENENINQSEKNDENGEQEEQEDNHNNKYQSREKRCSAVCAMCCKQPAMEDSNSNLDIDNQIEQQIAVMEQKLNRPLKLRETKAIERKVIRAHEKEKERLKEERRRAREEEEQQQQDEEEEAEGDNENGTNGDDNGYLGRVEEEDGYNEDENDDDFDPFLQAIGGQDKLVTGEAYQRMILEKMKITN